MRTKEKIKGEKIMIEKILLNNDQLKDYFSVDADVLKKIETGEIKSAMIEIDTEKKVVQYSLYQDEFAEEYNNANVFFEDDFNAVSEFFNL